MAQSRIDVMEDKDGKLHITIDPTVSGDVSKSGLSYVLASTRGFMSVSLKSGKEVRIGLNVIRSTTPAENAAIEASKAAETSGVLVG